MTAQFAELLEYKGQETALFCEPLEDYWDLLPPRPRITESSTACYRGYIGKWRIDGNGRLLLLGFKGAVTTDESKVIELEDGYRDLEILPPRPLTIETLFPGATLPIHASWYSGTLRCPLGEIKNYVHQGYSSEYQRDLLIEIKDGVFVSERERVWSEESGEPLNPDEYKAVARGARAYEESALQWGRIEMPFDLTTHVIFNAGDDICGLAEVKSLEFWNAHTRHKVTLRTMWFRIMSKSNYLEFARDRMAQADFTPPEGAGRSPPGFIDSDIDTILDAPIWTMAYFCLEDAAFQTLVNAVRRQHLPAIRLTLGPRPVVGASDANGRFSCDEYSSLTIEKVEIVRYEDAIRMQTVKLRTTDFTILDECRVEIERATRHWIQMSSHTARIGFELAKSVTAERIKHRVIDRDPPFDLRLICEAFVGPTLSDCGEHIRHVHYRSTELSKRRWFDHLWEHATSPAIAKIPDAMRPDAVASIARWYVDTSAAVSPTLEWAMVDALLHVAVQQMTASNAGGPALELLVSAYYCVADAQFNAGAVREVLYRAIGSGARVDSVVFDILDKRIKHRSRSV